MCPSPPCALLAGETAQCAGGTARLCPSRKTRWLCPSPPCLQDKERNVRAAHGAVAPRQGIKFIAVELCRERLGEHVWFLCLVRACCTAVALQHSNEAAMYPSRLRCIPEVAQLPRLPHVTPLPHATPQAPPSATSGSRWRRRGSASQGWISGRVLCKPLRAAQWALSACS